MRLYQHYCSQNFTNTYIVGTDYDSAGQVSTSREAVIIDPGAMDSAILKHIENNGYALKAALITHEHDAHVAGLRSLKRIYDIEVYSAGKTVLDHKENIVHDNEVLKILSGLNIQVFSVPGHSSDSVVYRIENLLFTGDSLSAGLLGSTDSSFGAMRLISTIQKKIFALQGNLIILPGHGPLSTLDVERVYNTGIGLFQEQMTKSKRPSIHFDFIG
ncbi:MAG: MBL fold metallo-hydrolase [Spirochaetaceae bacterium]|jgi:glyoxylase-like metal-dependent hydrolase (beta-lactamase superfamily II)|nr:MBL fold metallo-hydrolase [Spirochaetaceae bacterium]